MSYSYQNQPQPQLNGAYYGPPIAQPPRDYNRTRRRGGADCCLLNCLCDCGCYILNCILKIICFFIIVIGLILLAIWLIFRPHELKFHVTCVSLSSFNLSDEDPNYYLNYNLVVNFTIRNPNKHLRVYWDQIEATAMYSGHPFKVVSYEKFCQGSKSTTSFGPVVFKGENGVELRSKDKAKYDKETIDGVYEILVRLDLRERYKFWGLFKSRTFKPKVNCPIKVPLDEKSSYKFDPSAIQCYSFF